MAVFVKKDNDGRISFIKLSLGACTPVPHGMEKVEAFLTGKIPSQSLIWEAGALAAEKMIEITGRRSSTIYKEPAIQGLFMRILYPVVKL